MKRSVFAYFFSFLLVFFFFSCEKPYNPANLDTNEKIPVIQGAIHNDSGPYSVTLFWASSFGNNKTDPIKDAEVFIFDDQGNKEQLVMSTPGYYYSSHNFVGVKDRTYKLHVLLSNGDIYESTPARLEMPPVTFSLYEKIGTLEDYIRDPYDNIITVSYDGLYYYVDMTLNTTNQHYFYYSIRMTAQSIVYLPSGDILYCWRISYLNTLPNIKATIGNNNEQIIKEHPLGFIRYIDNIYNPSTPANAGWVLQTNIYSISREVFNYYQSVVKQLNNNNQIFDPIPSQIQGNIKCLTDTGKIALGVFEVSARFKQNVGVYWKPGSKVIKQIELSPDYEGPLYDNCFNNTPPDFWVNF